MRRFKLLILIFIVVFYLVNPDITAQQDLSSNKVSYDSLFFEALNLARDGNYEEAFEISEFLLELDESYYDASILLARIYAWENQYDSARLYLYKVTGNSPGYYDALLALIDVEIWDNNYKKAAEIADNALSYHPGDEDILLKKAKALFYGENIEEAQEILEYLLEINPDNEEALKMTDHLYKRDLFYFRENNYLLAGYYGDFFNEPYSRHLHIGTAGYSRYTPIGPVTGKINFANVYYNGTGITRYPSFQYEIETYPAISSDAYLLLNYAYSPSDIFPQHRGALEYFRSLPRDFEASLGLRFLQWDKTYFFYTGSASRYYHNMWFSMRTYIFPSDNALSASWNFTARKYFNSADEFAGVSVGYGLAPDETFFDPDDRIYLNTTSIGLDLSKGLSSNYFMRTSIRYEYEEYVESYFRNRWVINVGLRYYF